MSETLVSLFFCLSQEWLSNWPKNISFLPFAFFPAHWTFIYLLKSRRGCVCCHQPLNIISVHHQHSSCWGWSLSSVLPVEALNKWEEERQPFHQAGWESYLLSSPWGWLISASSGSRTGRKVCEMCGYSVPLRAKSSNISWDKFRQIQWQTTDIIEALVFPGMRRRWAKGLRFHIFILFRGLNMMQYCDLHGSNSRSL